MINVKFVDNSGVIFTLSDVFSFDEVEKSFRDLFINSLFPNLKYWIIDRTNTVNYNITADQVMKLSCLCKIASEKNKSMTQILVAASSLQYGMGRMYEVFESDFGWNVMNFRDISSAKEWVSKNIPS